jgi:hypothetical protein
MWKTFEDRSGCRGDSVMNTPTMTYFTSPRGVQAMLSPIFPDDVKKLFTIQLYLLLAYSRDVHHLFQGIGKDVNKLFQSPVVEYYVRREGLGPRNLEPQGAELFKKLTLREFRGRARSLS